jgi:DUF2075 family protein
VLAYVATRDQFLLDAPDIEEIVRDAVLRGLGIHVSIAEFQSWRNSLGNAMFHVIDGANLPPDAGVAIEFRLHGRQQRIDFMVSGMNKEGVSQLVLIELKQWTEVTASPLEDHVRTFLGGSIKDVRHPSYQSWSYARVLEDFYTVVDEEPIAVSSCAYLHNCVSGMALRTTEAAEMLGNAPVFLKHERQQLQQFLEERVEEGDRSAVIRRVEDSKLRPSKQLIEVLGSMLDGNEEFVLIDEQKTAYETIRNRVRSVLPGERLVLVIRGGPGTGKSVIAVNALVSLLSEGFNVRYVTKNAAPRAVFREKLRGQRNGSEITSLFVSSDSFFGIEADSYDVLLVDEAHRLVAKSGFYKNLGENQIGEIISSSPVTVFFVDESQAVTWRDIGTAEEIRAWALRSGASIEELELEAQFRCAGSTEYLQWLDVVMGITDKQVPDLSACEYEINIVDSPSKLRDIVIEHNKLSGSSRLLAGYCWQWSSKYDNQMMDIEFPGTDFSMKWNLNSDGSTWIISPTSINEVGCIHTCQGLEGDFMGVIIGPDLAVSDGHLVGRPEFRAKHDKSLQGFKKALREGEDGVVEKADRLIRNTYRTLMTRGMKGTFIYCTDKNVAKFLRESLQNTNYNIAADL